MSAASRPVVLLAGTRPEALKLRSLLQALRDRSRLPVLFASSGQHADAVRAVLAARQLTPDLELASPAGHANVAAAARALRDRVAALLLHVHPALLVVQGDTTTAFAGALAARACGVPLAHVEAGLRTDTTALPFPEEYFRRRITAHAHYHFAPTPQAKGHLLAEGVADERVRVTGNTGIDALRDALSRAPAPVVRAVPARARRLITLTLHRRENHGAPADAVCDGLIALLRADPALELVCPLHGNPAASARLKRRLGTEARVQLTPPLPHDEFVALLARSALIVTDSGGIQEEAPYLGVPLLLVRANTERPECLHLPGARRVPAQRDAVLDTARALLAAAPPPALPFSRASPFGDGRAGERIAMQLQRVLAAAAGGTAQVISA